MARTMNDAEYIEQLEGEVKDLTEVLDYRDRDIEKFRKGMLALVNQNAQLAARMQELEAALTSLHEAACSIWDAIVSQDDTDLEWEDVLTVLAKPSDLAKNALANTNKDFRTEREDANA